MKDHDEPIIFSEVPLTGEMRRMLSHQIFHARVFGYPAAMLLGALTVFVAWLLLALESVEGFSVWVGLIGVLLVMVCGGMTWVVGYSTRLQVRTARADLKDGRCLRVIGHVHVAHEPVRLQMFLSTRYVLELEDLRLPVDLYAAYALEGVDSAIITFTRHTHRVLMIRSIAGDLLFSAPGLVLPTLSGAIAL